MIVVFLNVINQTVARKNAHRHHVTVAFQSATKKRDAKKSASQKNQNANGQTGHHSAHAVHLAMKVKFLSKNCFQNFRFFFLKFFQVDKTENFKELNAAPETATADPISMNQKLICQDQDAKETLSKKNLAIMDHVVSFILSLFR